MSFTLFWLSSLSKRVPNFLNFLNILDISSEMLLIPLGGPKKSIQGVKTSVEFFVGSRIRKHVFHIVLVEFLVEKST